MIIADSSVWIDYFKGNATAEADRLDGFLRSELIAVGDLILTEVLQGFRSDSDFRQARSALLSLDVLPMVGPAMALTSAQNFRHLRRQGVTVRKTIDLIIASFCVESGHRLLFSDRNFEPFVLHLGLKAA
ncbi:MAG: PIN domain nuclease [Propionibacteriaceae bacterium]|nr:PIN domain nuclease [Propionibacteriaceae bacterium]